MARKRHGPKQALKQAEAGDLRPQFNSQALVAWRDLPTNLAELEPILRDRFFQLARPIADASQGSIADMRLSDAGRFFYLVETLERMGYQKLEETLLMILDEFQQLEPGSYNELYLWSIVELSRTDTKYVHAFWPMVLALDERYRGADWQRAPGVHPVDQPYRLCELVFYYFVISTLHILDPRLEDGERQPDPHAAAWEPGERRRRYPSLGTCLMRLWPGLPVGQREIVGNTLRALRSQQPNLKLYGDAYSMLFKPK
ncbi:MAG: hypothetical protein AB7K24_28615 [Gemmataceae bacterium]